MSKKHNEYDAMKDVVEYQKHMYDPGHYVGTGRVPPTVSAPGNAMPLVVLWFFAAGLFLTLGILALVSDAQFASSGLIESDAANKAIVVVIMAHLSAGSVWLALAYLKKVRRYRRQKAAWNKNPKKK